MTKDEYELLKKKVDKEILLGGYPYDDLHLLLEHRRANNIFEVGDLVILPYTNYRSDVFELTKLLKETYDEKGVAYSHATPQEIEAGRRL